MAPESNAGLDDAGALPESPRAAGANPAAGLFPIRVVAELTGINAVTIRAWERRYGLVRPTRTPGGHRLYRRVDLDRLHAAAALTGQGMSISRAARLLLERATARPEQTQDRVDHWLERFFEHLGHLDDAGMHAVLDAVAAEQPQGAIALLEQIQDRAAGLPPLQSAFLLGWLEGRLAVHAARETAAGRPRILFLAPRYSPACSWTLALAAGLPYQGLRGNIARADDAAEALEAVTRSRCAALVLGDGASDDMVSGLPSIPAFSRRGGDGRVELGDDLGQARARLAAGIGQEAPR
jgi:DNA-binding transcriptional MerR regulator